MTLAFKRSSYYRSNLLFPCRIRGGEAQKFQSKLWVGEVDGIVANFAGASGDGRPMFLARFATIPSTSETYSFD